MRLTQIKLAGFKSFVDPTNIAVPGQLVGVVGPNGCGKSNVIDAVRWVLGESSAKQLRGETMQDVIFAGSSERKQLGRASVELVFDNSLGRISGPWAQYSEISVKRIVTREGESTYYINSQHVRRKDVTDMFLGTGLGPRAYSIIEQGMISRVITAKPEELRVFLEEAAGVSKYRERRRETELRLEDTRENLSRVSDILSELDTQLNKLTEQAEVAKKYHELRAQLTESQQLILFTRAREAGQARERYLRDIGKIEVQVEGEVAKLREAELKLEKLREAHYSDTERLSQLQGALYAANADVEKVEQELTYLTDTRGRLTQQIEALADEVARVAMQVAQAETDRGHWHQQLSASLATIESRKQGIELAKAKVPEAEQRVEQAVNAVKTAEMRLKESEAAQQMDQLKENQALKVLAQLAERKNRLKTEQMSLPVVETGELEKLELDREAQLETALKLESAVHTAEQNVPALENDRKTLVQSQQELSRDITQIETQLVALKREQAKLEAGNQVTMWASRFGLDRAAKLWQGIKVEPGWEDAIEAVLAARLNASRVNDRAKIGQLAADAPPGAFAVYLAGDDVPASNGGALPPLVSKVSFADDAARGFVQHALAGCYAITNAGEVSRWLNDAAFVNATFVTPQGHVFSRHGAVFYGPSEANRDLHGVLQRQREIETLTGKLPALTQRKTELDARLAENEHALNTAREHLKQKQSELMQVRQQASAMEVQVVKLRQSVEASEQRRAAIKTELEGIETEETRENEMLAMAQDALSSSAISMDAIVNDVDGADRGLREARAALDAARAAVVQAERELQQAQFEEKSCHDKIASLTTLASTLVERSTAITSNRSSLSSQLSAMNEGAVRDRLQVALAAKKERESALGEARRGMESLSEQLRTHDEERLAFEQAIGPMREKITELRFKEQEARVNEEQFRQQLADAGGNAEELAQTLEKKTRSSSLAADIQRLTQEIEALGAVNMAALQELGEAQQRKDFLDKQSADLNEAVATLEAAIKRIDRETRDVLQTTFEEVNRNFGELFPSLFGGGQAYLKLTGEEILDAGLQVFAQPPGKKNQSIQLLSGGEKALSALSLVFALFRLNPAPFCLLDEVDAPLDDSNTVRYCDLVKKMSEQTQFVFITHNKITMEMAEQLVGVTMQEPGVSRIVEVDVDTAMEFARKNAPQPVAAVAG